MYIYTHIVTLCVICKISSHQMFAVKPNESPEEPGQRDLILADDEDGQGPWIGRKWDLEVLHVESKRGYVGHW